MTEIDKKEIYGHSKFIMASYGSRETFGQWITSAFGFMVFFYYEAVVGLDVVLAALAYVLYSVWNAVNDPLIGYLMEKVHMPWEKKWNLKRFPWIVLGAFPWLLSFLLVFMVPSEWDPVAYPSYNWPVFGWFLFSICLYDTFNSLFDVNVLSLYPEAVAEKQGRHFVYLIEGETQRIIPVKLGKGNDQYVEVLSGLKANDRILANAYQLFGQLKQEPIKDKEKGKEFFDVPEAGAIKKLVPMGRGSK